MPRVENRTSLLIITFVLLGLVAVVLLRDLEKSYTPPTEEQLAKAAALVALPPGSLIETSAGVVLVTRKGGWEGVSDIVATRYAEDMPQIQDAAVLAHKALAFASPSDPNYAALASEFLHTLAQRPPQ